MFCVCTVVGGWGGGCALTVTADWICFDRPPFSVFSSGRLFFPFFLFSANKLIPRDCPWNERSTWTRECVFGYQVCFTCQNKHTHWHKRTHKLTHLPQALAAADLSPTLWGLRANWLKRSHAQCSVITASSRMLESLEPVVQQPRQIVCRSSDTMSCCKYIQPFVRCSSSREVLRVWSSLTCFPGCEKVTLCLFRATLFITFAPSCTLGPGWALYVCVSSPHNHLRQFVVSSVK